MKLSDIQDELSKLKKLFAKFNNNLENIPKGRLKICKNKKYYQYIHVDENGISHYINKNNLNLAKLLAQKTYSNKIYKIIKNRIKLLEQIIVSYTEQNIDSIFTSLSPQRQSLVTPIEPTIQQKIKKWKSIPYIPLAFKENAQKIYTNKGERVRSKSEKIYADLLTSLGIEYKYEAPLILKNRKIIYPDFTLIDPYTSEEVFWEHFGMMDNPDYALKAIKKIEEYERNGFILGKNLIVTFEGDNYSTSLDLVRKKIIDRFVI